MAAAVFNVYTVRDQVKQAVKDFANGLGAAGDWLSDDEYDSIILDSLLTSEGTYTLTKMTTGIYQYQTTTGSGISLWLADDITPFTGDADVTYKVYAQGLKVKSYTTGGTVAVDHSSDSIEITGAPVDYHKAVADCFGYLKSHRATEVTQSASIGSVTIDITMSKLNQAIAYWQGVHTSAS
jgi:hypothetical protein